MTKREELVTEEDEYDDDGDFENDASSSSYGDDFEDAEEHVPARQKEVAARCPVVAEPKFGQTVTMMASAVAAAPSLMASAPAAPSSSSASSRSTRASDKLMASAPAAAPGRDAPAPPSSRSMRASSSDRASSSEPLALPRLVSSSEPSSPNISSSSSSNAPRSSSTTPLLLRRRRSSSSSRGEEALKKKQPEKEGLLLRRRSSNKGEEALKNKKKPEGAPEEEEYFSALRKSGKHRCGASLAKKLRLLLVGDSKPLPMSWRTQGLSIVDRGGWRCGLEQFEGGPCAVVATIQALLVDELERGAPDAQTALDRLIVAVVWRARRKGGLAVVCTTEAGGSCITERLVLIGCKSEKEVEECVSKHRSLFTERRGCGASSVMLSALFSRGLDLARADGDDPTRTLIDSRGYGNFELINLLLFGVAHSNAFDGVREAGGVSLRGAPSRAPVGLLAADEARGYLTVGSRLKDPVSPIWIVYSESHFSVLWQNTHVPSNVVELLYWDPLAVAEDNAEEPTRLTATPGVFFDESNRHRPLQPEKQDPNALVPPLDVVIRTRWPTAAVDWNGAEPIL